MRSSIARPDGPLHDDLGWPPLLRTRVGTIALSLAIAACGAQAPAPREVPERVERPVTEYETDAGRRAPTRTEPPRQAPPPEYGHRIVRGAPDAGTDATER